MKTIPPEVEDTCMAAPMDMPTRDLTNWLVTKHNIPYCDARKYSTLFKMDRAMSKYGHTDERIRKSFSLKRFRFTVPKQMEGALSRAKFEHLVKRDVKQ